MTQPIEGDAERPVGELDPVTGYRITPVDALARLERIADIVDSLAYAVGCGLEGTRTAKNIREAVAILRAALRGVTVRKDAPGCCSRCGAACPLCSCPPGSVGRYAADALVESRARLTGEAAPREVDEQRCPRCGCIGPVEHMCEWPVNARPAEEVPNGD